MKVPHVALCLALCFALGTVAAGAQDLIYLKTGESFACRVDDLTDNIVNFSLLATAGTAGGSARRTIPAEAVAYIEFDFKEGEAEIYETRDTASAAQLKIWWDLSFAHLHRPRARTAAYGIALADAILREEPETGAGRALSIFDRVIAKAWAAEDTARAKQGRLRSLMALGDLETATHEASALARETEDPGLLIEVHYLLATADFQKLKDLEKEHPRWEEDDEVRPERNELFHRAVDAFLRPHLFHATREQVAARGLFAAAELYYYAGDTDSARARWEDLVSLYPDTTFVALARERLASLQPPPSPEKDTDTPCIQSSK